MIRKSALAAIIAVALVATPQAQAADAAPSAGTWLVSQFSEGDRLLRAPQDPASGDTGLTADGIYALAAAGVGRSTAEKAAAWLAQPDQIAFFLGDGEAESYVGGLVKLALVAQTLGTDPHKFAAIDLLGRLSALQEESGRYRDRTDPSFDQTNAFTQALAIIVLKRAGQPSDKPVTFQVSSQCPDGGFPIQFEQATCKSDVDATAIVLQALLAAGEKTATATASAKGLDWLAKQQQADGGFQAMAPPTNANTTGLAVGALVAGGRAEAADKAVAFLKTLQVGCAGPVAQRGAVSFDRNGFDAGTVVRATTQAMLGLARVSLATVSAADATAGVPALDCTTPPSPSPEPTAPPAPAGPEQVPADPPLAVTGPDQAGPLTLFGSFAVIAGAVLLFVSRRRKVGA
ncbi:prenyltransferase/squalene oxidase repeat-containing protein [Lentzea sp. NPDC051213]|uniref:prenyltransferase/squalene oxidase repeat-containing protein n=1 Tax=Lentzea sp. NPDC051213 TaxID=3364126 RepID=UPI00378855B6